MSYDSKLIQARSLLTEHYGFLGEAAEAKIDELTAALTAMGATTEVALKEVTVGDLEAMGVPKLLARQIARIFGSLSSDSNEETRIVIFDDDPVKMAARMKPSELVKEYDPDEPDNPFGERLQSISGGKPFIVFDDAGAGLDVPVSTRLLQEIRDHYRARETVTVAGRVRQVYCVGDRPLRYADEHPMYVNQMIHPDGFSDDNIEWGVVPFDVRQLLRVAVDIEEIPSGKSFGSNERYVYDAIVGKSFTEVSHRYPHAALAFEELKGSNELPQLKVPLKTRTRLAQEKAEDAAAARRSN